MTTQTTTPPTTTPNDPGAAVAPKLNVELSRHLGIVPKSIDELWRVATVVHTSGLAPKGFDRQEKVFVALAYALEMGMPIMSALQCLAVINGKVTMYGDAMLARVRGKPQFRAYTEWYEDDSGRIDMATPGAIKRRDAAWKAKKLVAIARLDRHDTPEPTIGAFSAEDAERSKLIGKDGPWQQYPTRMLMWRARGYCLRDGAADLLNNMISAEEAHDLPPREPEFSVRPSETPSLAERLETRASELEPLAQDVATEQTNGLPSKTPGVKAEMKPATREATPAGQSRFPEED